MCIRDSGYTPDEIAEARKFVANPDWGAMLRDVQASIDELKKGGPVGIMGFCMGGTISFLSACKLNGLKAAVCYYGGQIAKNADEKPKVPVQMHFGEKDASIPMSDVELIKSKRGADCEIYVLSLIHICPARSRSRQVRGPGISAPGSRPISAAAGTPSTPATIRRASAAS